MMLSLTCTDQDYYALGQGENAAEQRTGDTYIRRSTPEE